MQIRVILTQQYTIDIHKYIDHHYIMKKLKSYRFDDKTIGLIEELKGSLSLETNSSVLRRAIVLLKLADDTNKNGGIIICRDENGDRELIL